MGGVITVLRNVTIALHNGGSFTSEWIRLPEGYQLWQLVVLVHGRISTTAATLQGVTTWDTVLPHSVGSTANLATLTPQVQDITSAMGPMFRVTIASTADSVATISVFLTPKSQ